MHSTWKVCLLVALALSAQIVNSRLLGVTTYVNGITAVSELVPDGKKPTLPKDLIQLEAANDNPYIYDGALVSSSVALFSGVLYPDDGSELKTLYVVNLTTKTSVKSSLASDAFGDTKMVFDKTSNQLFFLAFHHLKNTTLIYSAVPPSNPVTITQIGSLPKGILMGATYSPSNKTLIAAYVNTKWTSGSIELMSPNGAVKATITLPSLLPLGVYYDPKTDDVIVIASPPSQTTYVLLRLDNKGKLVTKFSLDLDPNMNFYFDKFDPKTRSVVCYVHPKRDPEYVLMLVNVDKKAAPVTLFTPSPAKNYLVFPNTELFL